MFLDFLAASAPFASAGLLFGLASALHCLAMCGGMQLALFGGATGTARGGGGTGSASLLAGIHTGRILAYTAAGALVGAFGAGLLASLTQETGHLIARLAAALTLLVAGFALAGFLPLGAFGARLTAAAAARIGNGVSRAAVGLSAPGASALASASGQTVASVGGPALAPAGLIPWRGLAAGVLWGFLPCGMVYAALLTAVWAGSPTGGALVMLFFGIGTLPALVGSLLAAGWLARHLTLRLDPVLFRRVCGMVLIGLAFASLFLFDPTDPLLCFEPPPLGG